MGFVFSPGSLEFYVTDVAGTTVTDPSAPRELASGKSRDELLREQEALDTGVTHALDTFRDKLHQYQRDHGNRLPNFDRYPGWDQLLEKTDVDGKPSESGQFGPYVERPLRNPYTGTARVQSVDRHPGLRFTAMGASIAYVLDKSSGKVWAVDSKGQIIPSK